MPAAGGVGVAAGNIGGGAALRPVVSVAGTVTGRDAGSGQGRFVCETGASRCQAGPGPGAGGSAIVLSSRTRGAVSWMDFIVAE